MKNLCKDCVHWKTPLASNRLNPGVGRCEEEVEQHDLTKWLDGDGQLTRHDFGCILHESETDND